MDDPSLNPNTPKRASDYLFRILDDEAQAKQLPKGLSSEDIRRMYEGMVLIRAFDERQTNLQRSGRIGFCVTSTGEEAVQVGTAHALREMDWVYPYYRQYGLLLYRGVPVQVLCDQLYGNRSDRTKGRQMPVHYTHKESRFVSFSSVIGTHLPHAVGTAMASRYDQKSEVTVTYIGDGGTSSNDFHSALTLAGIYKPPLVIFIVNNQYAISQHVSKQCASETLHIKGLGYGVPAVRVDGNDVFAVYQASREAYDRARGGEGPTLIELLTYRVGPHSSSDDPKRYRGNESDLWTTDNRDPIARLRRFMEQSDLWSQDYENQVWENAREQVNAASILSEKENEPTWESLFDDVYDVIPPALEKQKQQFLSAEKGLERQDAGAFPL